MENDLQFKWDNSKNISNSQVSDTSVKLDESQRDQFKSLNKEQYVMSASLVSSNSTTAVINPLKNTSGGDTSMPIINISHSNEHSKPFSRRNTVQPLLKKPTSNAPTTSIKPLIKPAPTSDSFSQHTKSTIVSMHSSHPSSSISTPFNCQQPMTMGIATIQPQHFGYQNISNNRYPMMSIQNNYPTQQLTLTNGGLGTTVQLMPVMNQNNNQMNNSRMQSVPLFMAPIIGSHAGMLFQPNMTLMPQTSNPMQTFNIANTSYSNDYNHCQPLLSHTIAPTTTTRQSIAMPLEVEHYQKYDTGFLINTTAITTTTTNSSSNHSALTIAATVKENNSTDSKISSCSVAADPSLTLPTRPSIKQRGLIRSQIFRMKQPSTDEDSNKDKRDDSPAPLENLSVHGDHEETVLLNLDENKSEKIDVPEVDKPDSNYAPNLPVEPELAPIIISSVPSPVIVTSNATTVTCAVTMQCSPRILSVASSPSHHHHSKPSVTSSKRKLPSPEILDVPQSAKVTRISRQDDEQLPPPSLTGRKSPGSLFEKISHVIPDRKPEILQNNKVNKLTAVVRPEQRKMLVHYLDDLIIFESDEPFPTTNKMQVVKSALRAGNIKLTPQKSKLLTDQYLFLSADDDLSPTKHRMKTQPTRQSPSLKSSSTSFLEPLTIDIPTTATTATTTSSSCDSLDSSQVRPLSVCSYQSTLPASLLGKKASIDNINSPEKEMPHIEKERSVSSVVSGEVVVVARPAEVLVVPVSVCECVTCPDIVVPPTAVVDTKEQPPPIARVVSPVARPTRPDRNGLDRPVCEWTVADVCDFVRQTPGCENYVSLFQNHEIDGEALLLLSKDNLIQGALNMKIGPALKLCARIDKRKALDPPQ